MAKITTGAGIEGKKPFACMWLGYSIKKPVPQLSKQSPYSSEITCFEKRFLDPSSKHPYTLALLSCGHREMAVLVPTRGRCNECSDPSEVNLPDRPIYPPDVGPTCGSCGGHDFKISHQPNPHNEADLVTKVGQIVECGSCIREAEDLNWLQSLDPARIFHARFDSDSYYFFRRNPALPAGFTAVGRIGSTPLIDVMISRLRAILPTDAAYQSLAIETSSYGGMRQVAKRE